MYITYRRFNCYNNNFCKIIDVAAPVECTVNSKEIEKYQDLKSEITTMWAMRKVEVITVVVGALGAIHKRSE